MHSCLTQEIFLQKFRFEMQTFIGEHEVHTASIVLLDGILAQLLNYEDHLRNGRLEQIKKDDLSLQSIVITLQTNHATFRRQLLQKCLNS